MLRTVLGLLTVALISSACTTRMGDLTIASGKNVNLRPDVAQRAVEGKDCVNMILFIPLGSLAPNVEEAMDQALAQVPGGNIMTDVAIYQDTIFTYLFNQTCLRVKGDVGTLQ